MKDTTIYSLPSEIYNMPTDKQYDLVMNYFPVHLSKKSFTETIQFLLDLLQELENKEQEKALFVKLYELLVANQANVIGHRLSKICVQKYDEYKDRIPDLQKHSSIAEYWRSKDINIGYDSHLREINLEYMNLD